MFTIDTTITDLKVREKNILKILFSMNIHQVATPEMMLEDARSYVLFFRESRGKLFTYIALHLLTTDRKLYYSCSDNPFPDNEMEAVEEEALTFLEGLGAMIDEVDFTNMSDSAQDRWLDEQEIFSEKPTSIDQPAAPIAPETAPEASPATQPTAAPLQPEAPPVPQPVAAPVALVEPQPVVAPLAAPEEPQPVAAPLQPQPVSAPVPPIASPVQMQPQPTPVPQPVTPSVRPVLPPVYAEPVVTPALKPVVPTVTPTAPRVPLQQQQPKQQQKTSIKRQQETTQQAVNSSVAKASVMPQSREVQPAAGIVSRDKEALARLLASF